MVLPRLTATQLAFAKFLQSSKLLGHMWWFTPVIPALRQEDYKTEAHLGYVMRGQLPISSNLEDHSTQGLHTQLSCSILLSQQTMCGYKQTDTRTSPSPATANR